MKNFKKLWKWMSPYKLQFFLILILATINALGSVLAAFSVANILNSIIDNSISSFIKHSIISGTFFIGAMLAHYLYDCFVARFKEMILFDIRQNLITSIVESNYQQFKKEKSEKYSTLLVTELDIISNRTLTMLFKIISNVTTLLASIIGFVYLHYSLLVLAFILASLMFFLPGFFQKKMQQNAKNVAENNSSLLVIAGHWINGFSTLNEYNAKQLISRKLLQPLLNLKEAKLKDDYLTAFVNLLSLFLSMLAQMSMIILTGYLAIQQIVSSGSVLSTGNLAGMLFGPLSGLVVYYSQFQSGFGSLESIEAIINDLKQSQIYPISSIDDIENCSITTKGLSVEFDDGRTVRIPDIKLEGQKNYAIVGPSGIGKSVLLNLLSKDIVNYNGELSINHLNMKDISEAAIKKYVSYVPQFTYIFNMSAKENILLANPNASEEHYQKAIIGAGLDSVFSTWPNQDQTLIGDKNHEISGGQAQRIGIARALLNPKPIMLFDEITANLDKATAYTIEDTISKIPNAIKVNVTHHLSPDNAKLYDEIISFLKNDEDNLF